MQRRLGPARFALVQQRLWPDVLLAQRTEHASASPACPFAATLGPQRNPRGAVLRGGCVECAQGVGRPLLAQGQLGGGDRAQRRIRSPSLPVLACGALVAARPPLGCADACGGSTCSSRRLGQQLLVARPVSVLHASMAFADARAGARVAMPAPCRNGRASRVHSSHQRERGGEQDRHTDQDGGGVVVASQRTAPGPGPGQQQLRKQGAGQASTSHAAGTEQFMADFPPSFRAVARLARGCSVASTR